MKVVHARRKTHYNPFVESDHQVMPWVGKELLRRLHIDWVVKNVIRNVCQNAFVPFVQDSDFNGRHSLILALLWAEPSRSLRRPSFTSANT